MIHRTFIKKNILYKYWGLRKIKFGKLGKNVRVSLPISFGNPQNIYIEDNVFIGTECYFNALSDIIISEGTMIGPRFIFVSSNHNYNSEGLLAVPYDNYIYDKKIIIEKNVWIGAGVVISPGTIIREGAVIAAGTCIYGEIPSFSIVGSSKYRIIKERNKEQYLELAKNGKIYNKIFAGKPFIMKDDNHENN